MPGIRNVHQRKIQAPAGSVGALLDRLASDDDPLWPSPTWPRLHLDGGLAVGASGGHGPIRYTVAEYEPGRRVRFSFDPPGGLVGFHELVIEPVGESACVLRHNLVARAGPRAFTRWHVVIRWLHDAVVEDLLDNTQRAATGLLPAPARASAWVRLLRAGLSRTARRRPTSSEASRVTVGGRTRSGGR